MAFGRVRVLDGQSVGAERGRAARGERGTGGGGKCG